MGLPYTGGKINMPVSDHFKSQLDKAEELVNAGEYDAAVTVLNTLKARIIDQNIYKQAEGHEKLVKDNYIKKVKEETEKNGDPWERELIARSFIIDLELWRAMELLIFYSKLADQHSL